RRAAAGPRRRSGTRSPRARRPRCGSRSGTQPIFLEPVGEHLLAAARAAVDQRGDGLAPFRPDEARLPLAVRYLHGRRPGVEETEIIRLRPTPSVAQIPNERVGVAEPAVRDQIFERALIAP